MSTEESPGTSDGPAPSRPPLALIAGPTASGKSDLAVEFALRMEIKGTPCVIINADSAQVYRDLVVLSARPTPKDMRGIEHRLFGSWDGASACSAADWARRAKQEIAACHAAGALPVLVGGTGLYFRTLLDGIAPIPEIDPEIRRTVRALPVAQALGALQAEDPSRAALLAPSDSARIARALEVIRSTGKPLAHWQTTLEGGIGDEITLSAAVLLPEREALYRRCDLRFSKMLDQGAIEEVKSLLARDHGPDMPVMRAIGVPEILAYLRGDMSLEEAAEHASQATRNYAKRQFTWFRRQPPDSWVRLTYDDFSIGDLCDILFQSWRLT
ncbi:MAG: tRNA (adenosine(37)-N6)-dimethylallyltransferase MiaA [Sphingomonadaceae bacterium]|nr:tRNA (adenosine(37)-N6)-dimethylallyltransferase MiaA [Sphingomonadaceae bacterium]